MTGSALGSYDRDVLAWSERQADLLRRLAVGERPNETPDWPNLIEEIEAVGRSELRSCDSLLRHALVHLAKLYAWPSSKAAAHWRGETVGFLADARRCLTPSMRQWIDLAAIYQDACAQVQQTVDEAGAPSPLPAACPLTLDDLLTSPADIDALARRRAPFAP